jgi:hypothetical protein
MGTQDLVISYLLGLNDGNCQHIETALSHLFIYSDYVFKLKKSTNTGYVDLTSISQRKECCIREIDLNSRYAAKLYIGVLAIVEQNSTFILTDNMDREAIDYIVKMKRFSDDALLSCRLINKQVSWLEITDLSKQIAMFHKQFSFILAQDIAPKFINTALTTINLCSGLFKDKPCADRIINLCRDLQLHLEHFRPEIEQRQLNTVRGHGDLHANNICYFEGKLTPFDGVDFSEDLICIDNLDDFAFLYMDLLNYQNRELANVMLNAYLETTQDYTHLALLRLYSLHRALVRVLVNGLENKMDRVESYLAVAELFNTALQPQENTPRFIVAVGGLSGSGKSTLGRKLAAKLGAIHVRSDAIRKTLFASEGEPSHPGQTYSKAATHSTYQKCFELVHQIIKNGYSIVIDATFMNGEHRESLSRLAVSLNQPFCPYWCNLPLNVALERIRNREGDLSDANTTVRIEQEQLDLGVINWTQLDMTNNIDSIVSDVIRDFNIQETAI